MINGPVTRTIYEVRKITHKNKGVIMATEWIHTEFSLKEAREYCKKRHFPKSFYFILRKTKSGGRVMYKI